jgi:DNA-directed RNA polymerase
VGGKVTRKIAKQPTMTMPYGAGQFGYRQQIMDALRKIEQDTGKPHLAGGRGLRVRATSRA